TSALYRQRHWHRLQIYGTTMNRPRLFWRLVGAFVLVILARVLARASVSNQTTTSEFQQYFFRGQMVRLREIDIDLGNYYRARVSWDGVSDTLREVSG